jgi:Fe-S cluster assembly iron-binding protein IscA
MALDEPLVDEKPVQVNEIGLLIAEEAEPWVDEMTIDYVKDPDREGFTIKGSGEDCC